MNILSIDESGVIFKDGFYDLDETVYFIFRNDGLVITSKKENIEAVVLICKMKNRSIKDEKLIYFLDKLEFPSICLFLKSEHDYYMSYKENPNYNHNLIIEQLNHFAHKISENKNK